MNLGPTTGLTLDTGAGELIDILEHEHCWLPVFFPVFDPGHNVAPGDTLHATAGYRLNPDRLHPDYHIEGTLTQAAGVTLYFTGVRHFYH